MITIKLEDDPKALKRIAKATDMAIVLFEIEANLNKKLSREYESGVNVGDYLDTFLGGVEATFDAIRELFDEYNIIIDDLID